MKLIRIIILLSLSTLTIFILFKTELDIVDIYYKNKRLKNTLEDQATYDSKIDEIVLVNYSTLSRKNIADLIEILQKKNPKIISVYALFKNKKSDKEDNIFQTMLNKYDNIVLASSLVINEENLVSQELPVFDSSSYQVGFDNLVIEERLSGGFTATDVMHYYESDRLERQYSFASKVVSLYDTAKYNALLRRNKQEDEIFYYGNYYSFPFLSGTKELMTKKCSIDLEGKIVVLGYLGDSFGDISSDENIFYSPFNPYRLEKPDMFGVVVIGNIIKMILDERYIVRMKGGMVALMVLGIIGTNILVFLVLLRKWYSKKRYFLFLFSVLVFESFGLVILSYYLFNNFEYVLSLKDAILSVLMSIFLIEFSSLLQISGRNS